MTQTLAAAMLRYRGLLESQDGQADAALTDFRRILDVARSTGDEPTFMSLAIRLRVRFIAVAQLERTLAQGQPGPEALAAAQRLVELELAEPVLVYGMCGERAWMNHLIEEYEAGRVGPEVFGDFLDPPKSYTGNARIDRWIRQVRGEGWNRCRTPRSRHRHWRRRSPAWPPPRGSQSYRRWCAVCVWATTDTGFKWAHGVKPCRSFAATLRRSDDSRN